MPETHLITDDETRQIAEAFLGDSPWLGGATWGQTVIGPNAEYRVGFDLEMDLTSPLSEGQSLSWTVTFVDPTGEEQRLDHPLVLKGIRELAYGDGDWLKVGAIKEWFASSAEARTARKLDAVASSRICQQALYGGMVLPSASEQAMYREMFGRSKARQDSSNE